MSSNPFVKDRAEKIQLVYEFIKEHKGAKLSEILGKFGVEYGLREETIMSYLEVLEAAKKIRIDRYADLVELL